MTEDPRAGQEAARLFAVAQDWLRTSAPHFAPTDVDGTPCSCPVCRVVGGLRDADPDDVARFVDSAVAAVSSLAAQAGDLASSARDQAATWSAPEAWTGEDDDAGYAVDVEDDEDDDAVGDDDEDVEDVEDVSADRPESTAPDVEDDDASRRVRRIRVDPPA